MKDFACGQGDRPFLHLRFVFAQVVRNAPGVVIADIRARRQKQQRQHGYSAGTPWPH